MNRFKSIALLVTALLAAMPFALQEQQQDKEPQEKKQIVIPADDDNAIARQDFMRTKLLFTQHIFEGLTKGDFDLIKAGVKEVQGITEGEKWVAIDDDQYRKLTEDFKMTTRRLSEATKSGNIESIALRYYQMSTSCIDCHQHIRDAEYEL